MLQASSYRLVHEDTQVNSITSTPWERFTWNTYGFIREIKGQREVAKQIQSIDVSSVSKHQLPPHNLVVIIGESLRSDYMHCYGYPLENTPRQDSLLSTGDMIAFSDAVAPVPATVGSVVRMMTFLRNETRKHDWYNYAALTEVLKRAGYSTSWATNQETMGRYVQPITTLFSLADEQDAIVHSSQETYNYLYPDEDVLPLLKRMKRDKSHCQIIHLMGSHQFYGLRYTKSFSKYSAKDLLPWTKGREKDEMVAHYLNTVYYNDYVIGEIVQKYSSEPTLLIYMSDHGQALYDNPDHPEVCTHALLPEAVRVPLFFYISPSLQQLVPDLKLRISRYKDRAVMLDVFPNALCGLLGIEHKLDDKSFDFFSLDYDEERPRIVLGFEGGAVLQM